jgi:cbb3-type cytochrome oxidase subunit 3
MYKEVLNEGQNYTFLAEIGLVIFFLVFVGVTIVTLLRPKAAVSRWSRLPLEDGIPNDNDTGARNHE